VGVGREQTGFSNTSAASKEKKTRNWKTTQPISDMGNDSYSLYFRVGHFGSHSLCHHLSNFSVNLWWLITAARTAQGCGADRTKASASRDCEGTCHLGCSNSLCRFGAVSVQLLTCSYSEIKNHCLKSLAHPWQVLPWCLLLEETCGRGQGWKWGVRT